eukprot:TRINITY_DN33038_c0_g2_i1.p1 TRINITY_DN33038_c0_g2~~TRINITY_DN33038_c0_g2_i1.p1  ORF type:complete len:185 (+),score=22.02 TRINITY_DN33038_c0_g2_i1:45-599(+)
MIRRPPRSTLSSSSAASDVYKRQNMWCGPRTCSTSLMYSFHQRGDTAVFDEPLYAHHLRVRPDLERPYKDLVMATQENNGDHVVRDIVLGDHGLPVVLLKHMAKQCVQMNRDFIFHPESALLFGLVCHVVQVCARAADQGAAGADQLLRQGARQLYRRGHVPAGAGGAAQRALCSGRPSTRGPV